MKSIQIKQGDVSITNRYDFNQYQESGIYEFPGDEYFYAVSKGAMVIYSLPIDILSKTEIEAKTETTNKTMGGISEEVLLTTIRILTGREKT